jgi:WD40 repeat protein
MKKIFLAAGITIFSLLQAQQPELRFPQGHAEEVNTSKYSPDGKFIVTASNDKTAKIWNAVDGKFLRELAHTDGVSSATFSPDSKQIVTSSTSGLVCIWNAIDGKLVRQLKGHKDWASSAAFSPDGKTIVSTSWDNTIKLWDAEDGSLNYTITLTDYIFYADFSPDGKRIVVASKDGTAKVFDVESGKKMIELVGHTGSVLSARFSPDGKKIITCGQDKTTRIWSADDGELLKVLKSHSDVTWYATFSPDGKIIASTSLDKSTITWNADSYELLNHYYQKDVVVNANFSPDGKSMITSCLDYTATVWNVSTAEVNFRIKGEGRIFSAAYNPSGTMILTASEDKTAKIWSATDGKLLVQLKKHKGPIGKATFSPDGKQVITSSGDGTAIIWNTADGSFVDQLEPGKGAVECSEFSPDEKLIVTACFENSAQIWNAESGMQLQELIGHTNGVYSACFSPDGTKIVTASGDGTAKIWNVSNGKLLHDLKGHTQNVMDARFSPDGETVVTASWDGTAKIWKVSNGKLLFTMSGHTDRVLSAEYSRDGKNIVTASMDGTVRIWNALDGTQIGELKTVSGGLLSAAYSPDGKRIVCSSNDNTIKIWDAKTFSLIYTFFSFLGNEYIIQIPSGYYSCTQNAAKKLYYVKNLDVIAFDQLDIKYNRPDKVLQAIGNTDTSMILAYQHAYQKRIKNLGIDTTSFAKGFSYPEFAFKEQPEYEQHSQKMKIHISGRDTTNYLDRMNVWVNECPIWGKRGISLRKNKINSYDTTIEITLCDGKNRIETSVMNVNGVESFRSQVNVNYAPAIASISKTYFIGIGIDHFKDASHNLTWSSKDIRDISSALKKKMGENIVIDTLFNQDVTVQNIKMLKSKLKKTNVNDKVIIAYSGHGLLNADYDYFLSTYNVNFDKPEEGGLAYEEFENLLDSIPARQKLLMIDACHSGEVDKDEIEKWKNAPLDSTTHIVAGGKGVYAINDKNKRIGMQNSFTLMQDVFVNVNKGTGTTVISAAGGTQFAYENGELKNGVFTYCFLDMLKNENAVTVQELKTRISEQVETLTNGRQKPTSRTETSGVDWRVW